MKAISEATRRRLAAWDDIASLLWRLHRARAPRSRTKIHAALDRALTRYFKSAPSRPRRRT